MATKSALGYNGFTIPVGSVISFLGAIVPQGYLLCDGGQYNQEDYPQLFHVLDGIGYGQTANTFQVPDMIDYFVKGSATNTNTTQAGSAGTGEISFSITEANMPPFTTNYQNAITFNCNTDGHAIITSNSYKKSGGSPAQTFNHGGQTTNHPAGSVSVNLANVSTQYNGAGAVQTEPLASNPVPAGYIVGFCIKADY